MTIDVIEKDRMVISDIDNDWIYEASNDLFIFESILNTGRRRL